MAEATADCSYDDECDVLVVGSGGGALTGAYTAAREGMSVIVAEATEVFGGTTAYSGGGMWLPGNAVLHRDGADTDLAAAKTYYHAVVGERTPRTLQDAFLDNGHRLVDYLCADSALEFVTYSWPDYFGSAPQASPTGRHIVPMPLSPEQLGGLRDAVRPPVHVERCGDTLPTTLLGGQALIGRLLLALSGMDGVTLRRNAACEELLATTAAGENAVCGAVLNQDGGRRRVRARRGVLLASGGFERNREMRQQYGVPGSVTDTMGAAGNSGSAIRAAIEVGAGTDLMSQAWWAPGITHPDGSSTFSLWFTAGLFVDNHGERFVNESWPYDRIGRTVLSRVADGAMTLPYWMIYDDRAGERPPVSSTSVGLGPTEDYVDAGLWFSASTLEGLAARIGVPADAFVRTVRRFNGFATSGVDGDFGRGNEPYDRFFATGESPLVPLEQGPFHAAAFGVSDLGTKGGLRTDAAARVLDPSGAPIAGLYAAGNSMAAVSGTTYPGGGNPIGASMVFSHLAGLDMADGSGGVADVVSGP